MKQKILLCSLLTIVSALIVCAPVHAISKATQTRATKAPIKTVKPKKIDPGVKIIKIPAIQQKGPLTALGIITFTNLYRSANDKKANPLTQNAALTAAAAARAADMFKKQYFAHDSPSGVTPAEVVKKNNYQYLSTGENIAMGNFYDDEALVDAWLASPHHRENILNTQFTEIGVAVATGTFEGRPTWIAVQEFGRPQNACPLPPSEADRKIIDANNVRLVSLEKQATVLRTELDKNPKRTAQEIATYNTTATEYNALITSLYATYKTNQELIATFNTAVGAFNDCLATP